mgnify:CR=1 FL=1
MSIFPQKSKFWTKNGTFVPDGNFQPCEQDDGTSIDANLIGTIEPHGSLFVSLNNVNSSLRIKPFSNMHRFSENFIRWFDTSVNRNKSLYLNCLSKVNTDRSWSFFCGIEKLPFPFGPELSSEIDELHRRAKTTNKITSRLPSWSSENGVSRVL